ncbi:MAG: carboxypeptidase-like regulatory domain-containing protein [Bacteroidota bacterium]
MKRPLFVLLLIMILVLPGCGRPTTAFGYIVDQAGVPVAGLTVTLDGHSAVSGAGGRFDLSGLAAGTYQIAGAGAVIDTDPEPDHYLFAPAERTIVAGKANNLGTLTVYNMIGFGVIIQSADEERARRMAPAMKRIDPSEIIAGMPARHAPKTFKATFDLSQHICFIFLDWAPIPEAAKYEIYLAGDTVPVWISGGVHPGDPESEPGSSYNNFSAYLDLDDELTQIESAGFYTFHIKALNEADTVVAELPDIKVSLGMTLDDHPWIDDYDISKPNLTWSEVNEASGYRVRVYNGTDPYNDLGDRIYDSGVALLTTTSLSTTTISAGATSALTDATYYPVYVDAQYQDATGWPAEITRGIGGFHYECPGI